MRYLFQSIVVLAFLAACTSDPQKSDSAPQAQDPAGQRSDAEPSTTTPVHHEDAQTRATLLRLKGPEEERPTNRR